MANNEVDSLTEKLGNTCIPKEEGVSFAGQSLKLNSESEAMVVVNKINDCPNMEFLNLEGNTVGVEAAAAIAKALESQPKMRKALWKDMFTGRLKDEIPIALKHLSRGLMTAKVQLEVLDLSDNASGAIGVEGIVDLLKSPSCYTLKVLNLNNMGLGIGGAKLLASALKECLNNSKAAGSPLQLKVFIAGRNRLENEGITALAQVFEEIGSLEEIQVPQNGIYLRGIQALSKALAKNPNLRVLNLNDNTLNPEGSSAISKSLVHLHNLVKLDLGDCLMKSQGVAFLAEALENGHLNLEEVIVSYNSVKAPSALALIQALEKKKNLQKLSLDGNKFGIEGKEKVLEAAEGIGKSSTLGSMSEDEGSESDESDDEDYGRVQGESGEEQDSGDETEFKYRNDGVGLDSEEDYTEGESDEEDYNDENSETSSASDGDVIQSGYTSRPKTGDARDFLANPTEKNFNKLGDDITSSLIQEITEKPFDTHIDELMKVIIKVSSLIDTRADVEDKANSWKLSVTEELYEILLEWADERKCLSYVNNILPVHLGLIKDEETMKPVNNSRLGGCILAVKHLLQEGPFQNSTKEILQLLIKTRT